MIIKNQGKFNNIKMAKGLDLRSFSTREKNEPSMKRGISTGKYGGVWFELPKGKALFKTYDGNFASTVRNVRMYNELLCQELCHQVGIPCAEYEPATLNDSYGVVTYNVVSDCESIMPFNYLFSIRESSLYACSKMIDSLKEKGINIDKKEFLLGLYKMIIFDHLTLQTDRNLGNIHFIRNKAENSYRLSPLIDNEFAFGTRALTVNSEGKDIFELCSNLSFIYTISEEIIGKDVLYEQATDIAKFALKNPEAKEILDDILKNFDIKKAILAMKEKGFEISPEYEEYMIAISDKAKMSIYEMLEKSSQEEKVEDHGDELVF